MTRLGLGWHSLFCFFILAFPVGLRADTGSAAPDFKEVYDLIRTQAAGLSESELNQAAVQALVTSLGSRVRLLTNGIAADKSSAITVLKKTAVMENDLAYLRCDQVGQGLAEAIRSAYASISTNKLKGIVLDLRYAGGDDFAAAVEVVNLFATKEKPLLNWGSGMVSSKPGDQAITVPVAVLVNRQTAGAAEAFAAAMRLAGAGLILGSRTAGQAFMGHEFPLKNGDKLCIKKGPVLLGDETELTGEGVKPDISVEVDAQDERSYYADAFKQISKPNQATNSGRSVRRQRLNEAELVRERRDGYNPDTEVGTVTEIEKDKPTVQDPALARALDLLRGLSLVREGRS